MLSKKNNSTCVICGKGYYMCQSCKDQSRISPWKIHTDTSEHYKIFQIVRGYTIGLYDKDDARNKLKNVILDDLEDFVPEVQSVIKTILAEDKKSSDDVDNNASINSEKKVRNVKK